MRSKMWYNKSQLEDDTMGILNPDKDEFRMGSEIWKPNHLKSGQMAAILSKTIGNSDKNVQISNGLDQKYS